MPMTRNGKIARLPRNVREELNRRLRDGEQSKQLVVWLNSLSEGRSMLEREFDGRPINEQNLSEWKQRGYQEWLAHEEVLEQVRNLATNAGELSVAGGALGDHLAIVLAARYAAVLARWDGTSNQTVAQNVRALRALCSDIVELRRGDHSSARLKIEQERLELDRSKDEARMQKRFEEWAKQPHIKDRICGKLSPEERERRLRQIFGRDTDRPQPKAGLSDEALAVIEKEAKLL
jgi:hypothetical protein